jgi:hypothetical protein
MIGERKETTTITADEIIEEMERLTVAAKNKLMQLASTGIDMLKEGAPGLKMQHIFASWQ